MVDILVLLKQHRIVHGDLKLENIMLVPDGSDRIASLKLIDFGLAREVRDGELLKTRSGSEEYTAPEIILGKEYDGFASDIWAFGVIFYASVH